jgi:hypothetical protein
MVKRGYYGGYKEIKDLNNILKLLKMNIKKKPLFHEYRLGFTNKIDYQYEEVMDLKKTRHKNGLDDVIVDVMG